MKKIILIIGILTLLVSCDMPNNDSSNTDISNQTDITSEATNKENETPSSTEDNPSEEIEENNTSETTNKEDETPSSTEDDSTSESEETNYSNEFIVSSDVTWEEVYGDYVSYVHYNNNDNDTQSITYKVRTNLSDEFLFLKITNLTVNPSNTSNWIITDLSVYFMENDELKFISRNTSILIENVCINKENKEVHIYLIDKN